MKKKQDPKKHTRPRTLEDKQLERATGGRVGWGDGNGAGYACDDWESPVV